MNAYSLDLRERVMMYLDEGHTHQEACALFKICLRTLTNWRNLRKSKGSLAIENVPRSPHKIFDNEVLEYIKNHRDAYLRDIANHFGCAKSGVHKAFKRLGITRKKSKGYIVKETRKSEKGLSNL